jgi:hypothetical protein
MPCSFGAAVPAGWDCQAYDAAKFNCKLYQPRRPAARTAIVALGGAIPIAFVIVTSGVLAKLNTVMQTSGYTFYGVIGVVLLLWLGIIVKGSAHADRTTTEYLEAGLGGFSYLIVGAGGLVSLITRLM